MQKVFSKKARLALWVMTVCGVIFLVFVLLLALFYAFTAQSRNNGSVTFTYGIGSRKDASVEGEPSAYMPNGVAHANFTLLAKAYGFSQSGDTDEIRYLIPTGDGVYDTVTFYYNSRKATVNGAHITLSAPVRSTVGGVMVPCDFITQYMAGITVEVAKNSVRVVYEEGNVSLKPSLRPITPIEP